MKARGFKMRLTEEILSHLGGLIDIFKFIFNPPCSGVELMNFYIYEPRRYAEEKWLKEQIENAFNSLKRTGYLIKKKINNQDRYFLTRKGIEKILKIKIKQKVREGTRKFRNKYLIVIFDIPEEKKKLRDIFRLELKKLKFEQLQKSVWVVPYDVFKELMGFVRFYNLDSYVKFMLAEKVNYKTLRNL